MKFSSILKWIGYITAILSLIAGIRGITTLLTNRVETRRKVQAFLSSGQLQSKGGDYASAWQSLEEAAKLDSSATIRSAQENLAMVWLDNIRVRENEKFSDIAARVDPVLTRGVAAAKTGQRQADLLAHLGWSYFLRSREGGTGLDPAATYADAVKNDPNNPYAQAMWGHWILWNNGDRQNAAQHFTAALASNRERGFVRRLQLIALLNSHTDEIEKETVRVLNAIRKEHGSVDADMRPRLFSMYYGKLIPAGEETPSFVSAVSPAEHLATFHWLFDSLDLDEWESLLRSGDLCVLEEAAGRRDEARAGYEAIRRQLSGGGGRTFSSPQAGSLLTAAQIGSKRLSHN